jgi:hypothetical protein
MIIRDRKYVHPPWRKIAEELLKYSYHREFRRLKRAGALEAHLTEIAETAADAYEREVDALMEHLDPGDLPRAELAAQDRVLDTVVAKLAAGATVEASG